MSTILRKLPTDIQEKINKSLIPFYLNNWRLNIDKFYKNKLKINYENKSVKNWCCIQVGHRRDLYRLLSIRDNYYCFMSGKINYHTQIREIAIFKENEFQVKWVITGKNEGGLLFQSRYVSFSDSDEEHEAEFYELNNIFY